MRSTMRILLKRYSKMIFWIVCVTVVLAVIGIEIFVRVRYDIFNYLQNQVDWERKDGLPNLMPSSVFVYKGMAGARLEEPVTTKLNNLGFRGEYFIPDYPGIRIQFYGDSNVFSVGGKDNETMPFYLFEELRKRCNELVVDNLGIPALNFEETVRIFKEVGVNWDPDMAIFLICGNDMRE